MSRRRRSHQPDIHVPAIVVTYLGRISAGAMLIGGFLVWRIIETSAGSKTAADAAVIGLVMAFLGFGTGGMTALGAILASTGKSSATEPAGTPGDPVNVTLPDEPVQVVDAGHVSLDLLGMLLVSFVGSLLALIFMRVLLGP